MLSALTLKQVELIIANLPIVLDNSFKAYELKNGKFQISSDRESYKKLYYDLYYSILTRIQNQEAILVLPLYSRLAYTLVNLQFNVPLFIELLSIIKNVIFELVLKNGGRNTQLEGSLSKYVNDIITALTENAIFQKGLEADQLVQLVEEYAPSSVLVEDTFVNNRTIVNKKIYSLIKEDFYWEVQKEKYVSDKSFATVSLSIYNGKVYNLNQDIAKPFTDKFDFDQWSEFRSQFLNKSNTFNTKLKRNVKVYIDQALNNANLINGTISDSKISELETDLVYDELDIKNTFAGKGRSIVENILTLKTDINYFGAYEGSPLGNIDFVSAYAEYLYGSLYGRAIDNGFTTVGGTQALGSFNLLFSYGEKTNRIAGLNFLNGFKSLRSFKHLINLPDSISLQETSNITVSAIYNPIYAKYKDGLKDRFFYEEFNPYIDSIDVDLILFGLEQLLNVSNRLGDTIDALNQGIGSSGVLPGYEGLGSVSIQLRELSRVFISGKELETLVTDNKILPGFNGILRYLLNSYNKLSDVLYKPPLTGESLSQIGVWGRKLQSSLEKIVYEVKGIGYVPGNFIPNISFKYSSIEKETLVDQLRSLNFQESEIDQFLSAESFEELLLKFAPISDASDQVSFFRGYELSQLIYEFGGESAIDAYIGYLYARDENNLTRLLSIATKNKTSGTVFNESRYGRLVGLLINLTFAINPDQLLLFKEYLSGNDLTLFESITYLLQNKEVNLLLDEDKINLLKPITESLIYGQSPFSYNSNTINYEVANAEVPLALKKWTEVIGSNLGNASTNLIQNLYDKSNGLTSRELITILNTGSDHNHNEYGQLIDGYEGGRLTQVINYGYLSGVLHKLSYYNNSYQIPNFYIRENAPVRLDQLVNIIQNLISLLDLTLTNFINSLEYDLSQDSVNLYSFQNLVDAQNKEIEEISKIIQNLVPIEGDITNIGAPIIPGSAIIKGSPGVGNSPVPESIPREGTITPEQANQLSSQITSAYSFIGNRSKADTTSDGVINKFITFIEDNKLIVGSSTLQGTTDRQLITDSLTPRAIVEKNSNILDLLEAQESKSAAFTDSDRKVNVKLPAAYQEDNFQESIKQKELNNLINQGLIENFDALESCKRFGGENCDSRIDALINSCGSAINKAIYSQRDETTFSPVSNGSIGIDRPFGSPANISPKNLFLPYSKTNKPSYFELLGDNVSITNDGHPLKQTIDADPLVFNQDGKEMSSLYPAYYNSEYGLIESIKAKWEKDEPFKCSLLEDPYAYMACMNLLKCKRFDRSKGENYLRFCPKTLAGGLSK